LVVHTISAFDVFGPEKTVINECLALREAGWASVVVNFWDEEEIPIARKVAAAGVRYVRIPSRGKLDWRAVGALRRLIRTPPRVVVHSHGYKADLYSVIAARRERRPAVTTVHGWTSENLKVRVYERLQAMAWRFFDRVICVSEGYRQVALRRGVPEDRLVRIPNGIKPAYAAPIDAHEREGLKAELGIAPGQTVVAIIGRLGIEKGHPLFVEAARRVLATGAEALFLIVGEGAERTRIEGLIEAGGLDSRVKLLGHRDDVARLYRVVDVLAICSVREGLPNVLLEAMLNGVPAVATAVGGVPEVVQSGANGVLVAPGDAEGYVRALLGLVSDAAGRARLGAAARETIMRDYLFERRMERIRAIYEELDGAASRRRRGAAA
jgi:glycosyltransferase involved in cell wall biosynthesis